MRDVQSDADPGSEPSLREWKMLARRARGLALAMEFGFSGGTRASTIVHRISSGRARARSQLLRSVSVGKHGLRVSWRSPKGDLPVRHGSGWDACLTPVDRSSALISWVGFHVRVPSCPALVMHEPDGSVLGDTSRLIVKTSNRVWQRTETTVGGVRVCIHRP